MFRRNAARFVHIGTTIQFFSNAYANHLFPGANVSPEGRAAFVQKAGEILNDCTEMGLTKTETLLNWMIQDYFINEHSFAQLKTTVEALDSQFQQELCEHVFVQIDPLCSPYLRTPEEFARAPIFGLAVAKNFSSAMIDAREAGNCYACYRNTACVFHCMRVAEKGLIALASALPVPFKVPFEYENWHNIIEPIESRIRDLEQELPKGPVKAATLKFYSQAATQFFYFKHAWRNHVAHARDTYDQEQAATILTHVGDFMKYLAEGGLHD